MRLKPKKKFNCLTDDSRRNEDDMTQFKLITIEQILLYVPSLDSIESTVNISHQRNDDE